MFRISNDSQRAKTLASIEGIKKQRELFEKTKGKKIADTYWKGAQRLIRDFEEQIRTHDELK